MLLQMYPFALLAPGSMYGYYFIIPSPPFVHVEFMSRSMIRFPDIAKPTGALTATYKQVRFFFIYFFHSGNIV